MMTALLIAIASTGVGQTSDAFYNTTLTGGVEYPSRMAAAPGGGVYVTDPTANTVVEFDAAGAVVNTYGIPEGPLGIAIALDGTVFLSRRDGVVGVYDASFVFQSAVDPGGLALTQPNGLAYHTIDDELYVVDAAEHRALVFAKQAGPGGLWVMVRAFGMQGSMAGETLTPQAIAIDPTLDRLILADTDNFRVQVFDTTGLRLFQFGYRILYTASQVAWFARSEGIAVDSCSNIYIADALMGTVRVFDSAGNELNNHVPLVVYGTNPGDVRIPSDVLIDGADRMFVSSTSNAAIEVFDIVCTSGGVAAAGGASDTVDDALMARKLRRSEPPRPPDNPFDIVDAMRTEQYCRELDLNRDRKVDELDLEIAVSSFGGATSGDFLDDKNPVMDQYPENLLPPHLIDSPNICGRCHSLDGMPGGMLSPEGQENLCLSCHMPGGIALGMSMGGTGTGNTHEWGIAADAGGVPGPEPGGFWEIDLHLDDTGMIRCGTCHNPHDQDSGSPYLRAPADDGTLCKQCHRGEGQPTDHAVGLANGPEYCTDCHDPHATGDNDHLVKERMYSWYNGGMVDVGFTDHTIGVGAGGFVDPAAGAFGLCDVCHEYFDDSQTPPVVSPEFLALIVPHDENMVVCTDCHQHHNGFEPGLSALPPGEYVSADTCALCHTQKHADWGGTIHASAWDRLSAFGQTNPACLPCHTVGFGDPTGYVDQATTPELDGVQCENCHGAGSDHVSNPTVTPPPLDPTDAALCGACHTDSHHPTFDEWETSGHAESSAHAYYGSCDACHAPLGANSDGVKYNVECVACHDPHKQTGNNGIPDPAGERDHQLLYPEVVATAPSNSIADATDPNRFNLCGQCHHSRGRAYDYDGRAPHHSVQGNVYVGEMPMPAGEEGAPLVPNMVSDHAGLTLQCNTCHMHTAPHADGPPEVDAITGHSWQIDYEACAGCHGSAAGAQTLATALQTVIQARLDGIAAALGDPTLWEYIAGGGPPSKNDCDADPACTFSQDDMPTDTKKVRFLYHYILSDASLGVHNGEYITAMLTEAESLLGISPTAAYVGSTTCAVCHGAQAALVEVHAHAHKLTPVNGAPPTYPAEGIYAGTPAVLPFANWNDVSYAIGGYYRKARFITQSGNIYVGAPGPFDGATGVETQWNLEFPPGGSGLNWVMYHDTDTSPKPYNYGCFQCHTTGPQEVPGNFEDWAEPSVGCEACHGAGSDHIGNPSPATIVIDTTAAQCGTCHTRGGDNNVVIAKGGYIKHHEQYPELLAGAHKVRECGDCHEPHTSAYYADGVTTGCMDCHTPLNPGLDMGADHLGVTFDRGDGYTEVLTCESCHMPYATKSATAADPASIGAGARMGDIKTHVFNINTAALDYNAMFNVGQTELLQDRPDGEAAVTLDFACLRCHGMGNAPAKTLAEVAAAAAGYHP